MARVTVEDCLKKVNNRFDLVMIAAKRARQLELMNEEPTVEWENDKPTVVALREIAAGNIDASILLTPVKVEEPEEMLKAAVAAQAEASALEQTKQASEAVEAKQTEKTESVEKAESVEKTDGAEKEAASEE